MDSVGFVVEKFGEGGDFGKRGFDYIEEFFVGDAVELVSWVEEDGWAGGKYVGMLGAVNKIFNRELHCFHHKIAFCWVRRLNS